jgi:hypothetical protein
MKPIRPPFAICIACFLVLCACSGDKTSAPRSFSNDAAASSISTVTNDATGSGGQNPPGARPPRLGVPGPLDNERIPEGGTYDPPSGRFVVPSEIDERGATISRSYVFLDAEGAPQTAYDENLTSSISFRFTLDAQPSRDGHTGTIHVEHDLIASGLAGSETTRTWNGTMSERTEGVPPMGGPGGPGGAGDPGGPGGPGGPGAPGGPGGPGGPHGPGGPGSDRGDNGPPAEHNADGGTNPPAVGFDPTNMKVNAVSTIRDVVMPHPLGVETWPLSGSITRAERIEGGPNGTEERTSILTFSGTQYATLAMGDSTLQIDLKDPRPPQPPRPPRP